MSWGLWIDVLVATVALAVALTVRPWRALPPGGPPWPWLAWWAGMPLLWGADHVARIAVLQPLSGAPLLVLLAGWPLAMLGLVPVAGVLAWSAGLPWPEALHRLVWLGVLPGTLALAGGTLVRRWLPGHLFIYILGRAFLITWAVLALSGGLHLWHSGAPAGTEPADLMIGRFLAASGEAFLTGMLAAIFVAFRPEWLATYSDRLYLPK